MITIEQIDELRRRVNVSYEDAKVALEQSNGDLLDAIIYLEKNNKVNTQEKKEEEKTEYGFSKAICKVVGWCKKIIKKGNSNYLVIGKHENTILKLSLTITSIIIILAPWITIPLLILALFTGHKIGFRGKEVEKTRANVAMDKVILATNNIKEEFVK